ncbi:hypothetical protein QQ045_030234 [Rhodiola kirilowii]
MAKFAAVLILFLFALSMVATTTVMAKDSNVQINAQGDAVGHNTTNHACSSAKSVAGSANVYHQVSMATSRSVLATTIGRPSRVAPSALRLYSSKSKLLLQA